MLPVAFVERAVVNVVIPRPLSWVFFVSFTLLSAFAEADEPLVGYVFTTDLLPQGKYEIAQWATWRSGKSVGEFDVLEGRTEFEFGVSDRLQVSAYLNYEWAQAYHDNVIDGSTLPPGSLANLSVGLNERLDTTRFTGVSVEGICRIFSPYTNALGLALYVRPTFGPQFRELESRLILQKNYLDDRLVLAFNLTVQDDWRYVPSAPGAHDSSAYDRPWNEQSSVNLGFAGSYRFVSSWSAGLELQNERGFTGINPFAAGARSNAVYYFGPSLHYAGQHVFVTATYLDQLPFASDYTRAEPDFIVDGRNYSANHEKLRLRVKFGWYF